MPVDNNLLLLVKNHCNHSWGTFQVTIYNPDGETVKTRTMCCNRCREVIEDLTHKEPTKQHRSTLRGELIVQDFLQSGGTLQEVHDWYHVNTKRHPQYNNLVQFKYDQINADMGSKLVQQCRGLILDEDQNWKVVARPFDKFFNEGEPYAPQDFDWTSAEVFEKLDGTMIVLYYYQGWNVATLGSPNAGGEVPGANWLGKDFADLFWMVFTDKGYGVPAFQFRHLTFMFELMSPLNRVVVNYPKNDLKLIGIRGPDGTEYPIEGSKRYEPVRSFGGRGIHDMRDIIESFAEMNPLEQEGYVAVDKDFRRLKIKHPEYVRLHRMKGSFSIRHALEVVRDGEISEVITHFPEWTETFKMIEGKYKELARDLDDSFNCIGTGFDRKGFAQRANQTRWPAAMFLMLDGKASNAREALKSCHVDKLGELVGLRKHSQWEGVLPGSGVPMNLEVKRDE